MRAIAGRPRLVISLEKALTNSAAKCCESAALPPLPQIRTFEPAENVLMIILAATPIEMPHSLENLGRICINSEILVSEMSLESK